MKKFAFTLSETLITLTIIGVIAAITIPNMMIHNQKTQTVVQLKKIFSEFSQAATMAKVVYGDYSEWDYTLTSTDFFRRYFYPYITLSSQSIQDAKKDNINYLQTSGAIESSLLIMRAQGEIIELISGCQVFTYPLTYNSGTSFQRKCYAVDINGYKRPNKFGRDLFMLCLDSEHGVVPHSWDDNQAYATKTREQLKNSSSFNYNCCRKARGMWCSALIMKDNWEIKNDYPW